jgi:hypothetical protein
MQNFIGGLFRFLIKLVLTAIGLVFAVGLVTLALMVVFLSLLASIFTGKKPAPVAVFGRFQKFAPGGMWPRNTAVKPKADVVDVEVREVNNPADDKKQP